MDLIKKYWWVIILILLLPMLANLIVLLPAFLPVAGEAKDWLNFFAVFFSGLLAASVSFFILYKTIQTNNKENNKNRDLQIKAIEYQIETQWVNTLKNAIRDVYQAFNILWLDEIYLLFKDTNDSNNFATSKIVIEKIKQICDRVNLASDEFRLTIIGKNDAEECKFISEFEELRSIYCDLIGDISALSQICFHNGTDDMLKSQFIQAIEDHKSKCTQTSNDSHRLWVIAEKHSMKLKSQKAAIVKDLIDAYSPVFIYEWCKNVLQYEYNKTSNILNGTKQDK